MRSRAGNQWIRKKEEEEERRRGGAGKPMNEVIGEEKE